MSYTASADCVTCGWREHDAEFIWEGKYLTATVLECRACGTVSIVDHERRPE